MWIDSKNPVLPGVTDRIKVERSREDTLSEAAKRKVERDLDASAAMKEHDAARREALAKTAKLRAERLAREANPVPASARAAAKKK